MGKRKKGERVCCGVKLKVQDVPITLNFFLIELEGTEVVLGMD